MKIPLNQPFVVHRNLFENGRRRTLSPDVERFIRMEGAVLCAVLREDIGLALPEILEACQEYFEEHPETGHAHEGEPLYLVATLMQLIALGAAVVVPHRPPSLI